MPRLPLVLVGLFGFACASAPPKPPTHVEPIVRSAPEVPVTHTDSSAPPDVAPPLQPPRLAMLWEVTHPDRPGWRLFVAGSVHVGSSTYRLPLALMQALDVADTLVVELDPSKVPPEKMKALALRYGTWQGRTTLSKQLSPETRRALEAYLAERSLPFAAFDVMKPWLVSLTLMSLELQRAGLSPEGGVDQLLLGAARGHERVVELETVDAQLQAFAKLEGKGADLALREQLEQHQLTLDGLHELLATWERGDPEALAALVFRDDARADFAPMYEALFYARNRQMLEKSLATCGPPQTCLVVVGAGHVVGPRGLVHDLEAKGFVTRQVPRDGL